MATLTGSATDHNDLWSQFITFITSDTTLVADGEAWEVMVEHSSTEVVLRGPGLSAQDNIYVGMKLVERPTPDEYEIQLSGMSGILAEATAFDEHVNSAPTHVRMFLDSGPMTFWFAASGRRFVIVVKISTIFQTLYGGFILPYASPTDYQYPLFIGGSAGENAGFSATSWRSTDVGHRHFPHSYYDSGLVTPRPPSALLMDPAGNWLRCAATGSEGNIAIGPRRFHSGFGIAATANANNYGYADIRDRLQSCLDDSLLLTPLTLMQSNPSDQCYGIIDGCYHVPGFGNSSENTVGDCLVVQDAFRTARGEYWAVELV